MRIRHFAVVSALLLTSFCCAGEQKTDMQRIQGTWNGTKLEVAGKSAPKEIVEKGKYVFAGSKLTIFEGDKKVGEFTYTLDSTKMPKTIDITSQEQKDKGKTMNGIYKLDGDTLTLSFGAERPTDFKGVGKTGVMEFKRAR